MKKLIILSLIIFCSSYCFAVEDNKYIAFGDSITGGVGAHEGYPSRLQRMLTERVTPSTVINEGVAGERTFRGASRIDDVLNAHNAKYILIMEGTNDVSVDYSTETIISNLRQMIDKAINFGTTPLIAGLPPRKDNLDDRVKLDINPAISALAQEKGIIYVDQYTEMATNKNAYMSDYLHPNDAGYELMAEIWCKAIKDNILYPPTDDDNKGCGAVPPMSRNNSNGLHNNISLLALVVTFLLFLRYKFSK